MVQVILEYLGHPVLPAYHLDPAILYRLAVLVCQEFLADQSDPSILVILFVQAYRVLQSTLSSR